jgi:hypothetical protein
MDRRQLLEQMSLMAATAIMGRAASVAAAGIDLHAPPQESVFSDSHRRMIAQLAELIIPATDTPGAAEAGVPAFIEQIVSGWYTPTERRIFLEGCAGLEQLCRSRFEKPFTDCSSLQQSQALESAARDAGAYKPAPSTGLFCPIDEKSPFIFKLRQLTVLGYYTSEVGATRELKYNPVPGRYDGDVDFNTVGRQWSY